MKHNTAILIVLAIIIGSGDRVIDSIENGKPLVVIILSGLVGAAVAVKFLMERWQDRNENNGKEAKEPTSVPDPPLGSGVTKDA